MAHTPETKAKAVAMLRTGASYGDITKVTGLREGTISRWAHELKTEGNGRLAREKSEGSKIDIPISQEARQQRFDIALNKLLFTGLDMLQSWAELSGDKQFARENPTGAKDLGSTVLDRLDRIMAVVETGRTDEP